MLNQLDLESIEARAEAAKGGYAPKITLQLDELTALVGRVRELENERRWRSVRDELPQNNTRVYIRTATGHLDVSLYDKTWYPEPGLDGFAFASVTHWRPLLEEDEL